MSSSRPLVAMVAIREDVLPDERGVIERLRDSWPTVPAIDDVERKEDVISFDLGGDTVAVSLMKEPVPWGDLEGPCREAWYWPEAAESLKDHAAHILVVLVPKASDSFLRLSFMFFVSLSRGVSPFHPYGLIIPKGGRFCTGSTRNMFFFLFFLKP